MSFKPARKRFGQHFLHDRGVVERMMAAFNPRPEQMIVEIGPGRGALTLPLLDRAQVLHAVEFDRDIVAQLPAIALPHGQLVLHQADALRFDFSALATRQPLRVIGNLPYNISTPLLFHLLEHSHAIRDMMFMVQKEVADRLAAKPNSKDYGRLSVMIQWQCHVEQLFDVGPGAFSPPPQVESSIVRLVPRQPSEKINIDARLFGKVVQAAFAQRRKTLRNSLKGTVSDEMFTRAGIDSMRRAETLTIEEFARLSDTLR